jgi:two-component system response regulator VicR
MASIFLVDSDPQTIDSLQPVLAREGHRLDCAHPNIDALRRVVVAQPDLVILGMDGEERDWEFCRQLLVFAGQPVLLLLASGKELDRVQGLELGADDCLLKPFFMLELVARVRALLRRESLDGNRRPQSLFVDGDLTVNLLRHEVSRGGHDVPLSATEYRLLACFIYHIDELLSSERLLALVWGKGRVDESNLVKLYIHHLRQKIEPDPAHPGRIVTHRGEGYVFRRLVGAQVNSAT